MSRDTSTIILNIAALNDLGIKLFDIDNSYLNTETGEKVYFIAGTEFVLELTGEITVIVRAIYGIRYVGVSFNNILEIIIKDLGFKAILVNSDAWMKPAVK